MVQLSRPYMTTDKTIVLAIGTFVGKVISLLFDTLSRFVIVFLPRSFNFTIHSDFGAQDNKIYDCFHCFPIYLPWSEGTWCHDLSFFDCWVLSQIFHSPLSALSRGSLVSLNFLLWGRCHLHIWGYWYYEFEDYLKRIIKLVWMGSQMLSLFLWHSSSWGV